MPLIREESRDQHADPEHPLADAEGTNHPLSDSQCDNSSLDEHSRSNSSVDSPVISPAPECQQRASPNGASQGESPTQSTYNISCSSSKPKDQYGPDIVSEDDDSSLREGCARTSPSGASQGKNTSGTDADESSINWNATGTSFCCSIFVTIVYDLFIAHV